MNKENLEKKLINEMSAFVGLVSMKLPKDVEDKLEELSKKETSPLAKTIYETMKKNQELAWEMKRPSCQDTGVLQFFCEVGEDFPLRGNLEELLREATYKATMETPLRHNSVETFEEYNTGKNIGKGTPTVFTKTVPGSSAKIYTYMAGGGCSLPGAGVTLMPGEGYEAVVKFILDRMTSYGLNACPPLLVGVGIGTSIETAAVNSKLALMKKVGEENEDKRARDLEKRLEEGINKIGIGPQGFGGENSVMGVNIVNTARHPSVLSVALNVGCWSHRRGLIVLDEEMNYEILSHEGIEL